MSSLSSFSSTSTLAMIEPVILAMPSPLFSFAFAVSFTIVGCASSLPALCVGRCWTLQLCSRQWFQRWQPPDICGSSSDSNGNVQLHSSFNNALLNLTQSVGGWHTSLIHYYNYHIFIFNHHIIITISWCSHQSGSIFWRVTCSVDTFQLPAVLSVLCPIIALCVFPCQ